MTNSVRVILVVWMLTGGLFVACGILPGDKGLSIKFVNRTGESIVLYEKGRAHPSSRKEVAPEASSENVWVDSRLDERGKDLVKYRVEATTISGDLLFCHDFTFNELTRIHWVVEIRKQNDCPT